MTRTSSRTEERMAVYDWFQRMFGVLSALPADELAALKEWEKLHLDGSSVGTSDWPGWAKYIGPYPRSAGAAAHRSAKKPIPRSLRWRVWERDNFTCQHCASRRNLTVDHIIPECKGGTLDFANLQTLCESCNSRKGARL